MAPPRLNLTDDEKSKMNDYLSKKADFEDKRRLLLQKLEETDAKIIQMQGGYGSIYNKRNPVLRLPAEVTCLIFIFAQLPRIIHVSKDDEAEEEQEEQGLDQEKRDKLLMEVVVSHVCRQWRSISIAFPKLWSSFHHEADPCFEAPLHRFDTYMQRSAALPLRISLDFQSDTGELHNVQLVERAVRHAHRWKQFTIYSIDEAVMEPLHQLRDISAPMLEYLTLVPAVDFSDLSDDEFDDLVDDDRAKVMTSMEPRIFRGGAPRLTYLMLDAYSTRYALPPLSNITILRIEKTQCDSVPVFERTAFLELLSLPSLAQLSLCGDLIQPFGTPRTIHMPNLQRVRVGEFDTIWDLLPSIRAPQLDTLIIHTCASAGAGPPSPEGGYAFPALRKLYILDSHVDPSIAREFTDLTRQATDVLISHGDLQTSLLQTIVHGHYAGAVWPRLKTLTCNIGEVDEVDTYLALVDGRPRQSFVLRLDSTLFEEWDPELLMLRAVATVELEEDWVLNEPFWPLDGRLDFYFGKEDGFAIDELYN